MKLIRMTINLVTMAMSIQLQAIAHEMQHGLILSKDDTYASHLVATGPHSWQTEIMGQLIINDVEEMAFYQQRKRASEVNKSYFVFQAQQIDLPNIAEGMILSGHIIESKIGTYEPKNIVIPSATYKVKKVLLNILNPFFAEDSMAAISDEHNCSLKLVVPNLNPLLLNSKVEKRHCCETGEKPCNWKC